MRKKIGRNIHSKRIYSNKLTNLLDKKLLNL